MCALHSKLSDVCQRCARISGGIHVTLMPSTHACMQSWVLRSLKIRNFSPVDYNLTIFGSCSFATKALCKPFSATPSRRQCFYIPKCFTARKTHWYARHLQICYVLRWEKWIHYTGRKNVNSARVSQKVLCWYWNEYVHDPGCAISLAVPLPASLVSSDMPNILWDKETFFTLATKNSTTAAAAIPIPIATATMTKKSNLTVYISVHFHAMRTCTK